MMTDCDELLARLDNWIEVWADREPALTRDLRKLRAALAARPDADGLIAENRTLVAAVESLSSKLRAALAAQPQSVDARLRSIVTDLACTNSGHRTAVETLIERAREALVPEAVAGSATPTQEDPICVICGELASEHPDDCPADVAGSATPTQCHECHGSGHTSEFSRDGYVTCDWCGGSGVEPAPAGSASAPTDERIAWIQDHNGEWHEAVAGSSPLTEDGDERTR